MRSSAATPHQVPDRRWRGGPPHGESRFARPLRGRVLPPYAPHGRGPDRRRNLATSAASRPTKHAGAAKRHVAGVYRRIYAVVRKIPRGRVLTYGQVAELAGIPRGARVVGYALRANLAAPPVPWQRVVGRRRAGVAQVSIKDPLGGAEQRRLLEREGVRFSPSGGVDLEKYGWRGRG